MEKASTSVEVTAAAAVIDTTTAQIQNTLEDRELQDLPMASGGSGIIDLSLLNAGVGTVAGLGFGTGPSVGGQRPSNNSFTVEGIDNNDKGTTGPLVTVPNDAVAELQVCKTSFHLSSGTPRADSSIRF